MDKLSKSILEQIESGEYFKDARDWYARIYLISFAERSILFIFVIILIFLFLIVAWKFDDLYPKIMTEQFLVNSDDTMSYYAKIKPLKNNKETTSDNDVYKSIAQYAVGNYVIERESYRNKNSNLKEFLEFQKNYIKNNSTINVLKKFEEDIDIKNPNSPILKYRIDTRRDIKIENIVFSSKNDLNRVKVYFTAYMKKGKNITKEKAIANIDYNLTDITQVIDNTLPLEFKVSSYNVEPWTEIK